jgi:hypothetical protein
MLGTSTVHPGLIRNQKRRCRHRSGGTSCISVGKSPSHQQTGAKAMVRESSSYPRTDDALLVRSFGGALGSDLGTCCRPSGEVHGRTQARLSVLITDFLQRDIPGLILSVACKPVGYHVLAAQASPLVTHSRFDCEHTKTSQLERCATSGTRIADELRPSVKIYQRKFSTSIKLVGPAVCWV